MDLLLPDPALVLLVGPSGCGKSTFARGRFGPFETVSSDHCRALVANDENDQTATRSAFEVAHAIVFRRLERALLTVVDATSVTPESRRPLLELARYWRVPAVAIVFDLAESLCAARNVGRAGRTVPADVVARQRQQLVESLAGLEREGVSRVFVLRDETDVDAARVARAPRRVSAGAASPA